MGSSPKDDPSIRQAVVRGRQVVKRGGHVKHFGQRYTGYATAKVVGFRNLRTPENPWIKVIIKPERGHDDLYASWGEWDWDRTEVAPKEPR